MAKSCLSRILFLLLFRRMMDRDFLENQAREGVVGCVVDQAVTLTELNTRSLPN